MPQTADTFSSQIQISGPTNLPGGVSMATVVFSFGGTAASYDVVSPFRQVTDVHLTGSPIQITTGSTLDRLVLANSRGADGKLTLIAASTNGLDVQTPTILRASRTGTNNQDASMTIFSKGG